MRKLFDDAKQEIAAFSDQRDDLTLVLQCKLESIGIVLKLIESVEETSPNTFLDFCADFIEPVAYVDALVKQLTSQFEQASAQRVKEGGQPLPPEPASLRNHRLPPEERLRELMCYARSAMEDPNAVLVWVMMPLQIHDPLAYAKLITTTLRHKFPRPWCHHIRVIARDAEQRPLEHSRDALQRARFRTFDFGPAAVERSLEDTCADESAPLPERMTALMVLAGIDAAHKREAEAKQKYNLLATYHHAMGDNTNWALALLGLGDTAARAGNAREAKEWYLASLTPATEAKAFPVILNASLSLANLYFDSGLWIDAATWYHVAGDLSRALLNADALLDCFEREGLCYQRAGVHKRAYEAWNTGVELS
ncbi:MAG TPA: hypothetical protein VHM19_12125, partial [Polyangiales bacterium]|nr:hypothetical protein [Polyangiales bacterium]